MVLRSDLHRWTVAAWRLDGPGPETEAAIDTGIETIIDALGAVDADVIGLQWVRARPARLIANELDLPHVWTHSHHARRRLLPGPAIGLSVMTHHRITAEITTVLGEHASRWSPRRRVAQTVAIACADQSAFTFCHASGPLPAGRPRIGSGAPMIAVGQSLEAASGSIPGGGTRTPVVVPHDATIISNDHLNPLVGAAPLVLMVFEAARAEGSATG